MALQIHFVFFTLLGVCFCSFEKFLDGRTDNVTWSKGIYDKTLIERVRKNHIFRAMESRKKTWVLDILVNSAE